MAEKPPTAVHDPYVLTPDEVRDPPPTLGLALRKIGPGMILAASIVGTGELIATTHAGAKAGFAILWLVILSCFIKVFVQIELGRHAVSSGETTLASFARLPGPGRLFTWWWFFMMLTTQAQISAMIGGVGYVIHLTLPGVAGDLARPAIPWAVLVAVLTALLLVFGTYRLIERSMTALVVLFTVLTVACVVLLPFNEEYAFGWDDLAGGLSFHIPAEAAVIAAAMTMIGITGVGASELVSYPYWCIEKGYARNVGPKDGSDAWLGRARGWLRVMMLDAWVSFVVYTFATLAFFILGAAVLHAGGSRGLPNSVGGLLESLTGMYAPVLGPEAAKIFIMVGAFAVLYSTLVAATAANSRIATDFLRVNGFIAPRGPRERFRWVQGFCVGLMTLGLTLFLFFPDPVYMVMVGGFAQALTLPMIAAAAIYMRYRRTDRRLTPGLVWTVLLWLSLLAFVAAAAYGVWSQLKDLR
ncbi:MAG TPA: Nramp family divalent metal transporter [Gemmataceae bacterium]